MESGEGCTATAEWTIHTGPSPDDATEACTAHVGELLAAGSNTVYPLESSIAQCCYIKQ